MALPSTDRSSEKPDGKPEAQPNIGIALGAGGAKGIAHIGDVSHNFKVAEGTP